MCVCVCPKPTSPECIKATGDTQQCPFAAPVVAGSHRHPAGEE